jgi:hypothetical protein
VTEPGETAKGACDVEIERAYRRAADWVASNVAGSGELMAAAMLEELGVTNKLDRLIDALTPRGGERA